MKNKMRKKIKKFNIVFPWYSGLSMDLLFWVAIDTLFLTFVKNFSAAQITSLTTISLIVCICLQMPLLKIIKKIGNTTSVRLSAFMLLLSSIFLTFGNSYIIIVLGKLLYEIAFTFQSMSDVILKNNLQMQNKDHEYIRIKTKASTIYSAVTMIISFVASALFNLNNYLPMILCIVFCFICFLLSFYIVDYSEYDKITKTEEITKNKVKYTKIILIIIISYGIFVPIVNSGQSNGKLFIQQELLTIFNEENTAIILGIILAVSRIVRVISNMSFNKMYEKLKDKVAILLTTLLHISLVLMSIGSFMHFSTIIKFIIMSLGYIIILFIRDPFNVYMQNLALDSVEKEEQQTILTTISLARKIIRALMSFVFTLILIDYPMIIVIGILVILSLMEILISLKLYKMITKKAG